jgi:hypothetical protein
LAKSKVRLDPMPWTTFTDPEVAHVGQTEEEARRAHGRVLVLRAPFAHVDRAQAEGRTEGVVKLIVTPWRGQILGGHVLGPQAGALIQEVTLSSMARRTPACCSARAGRPARAVPQTEAVGDQEQIVRYGVIPACPQAIEHTWPAQPLAQLAQDALLPTPALGDTLKPSYDAQSRLCVHGHGREQVCEEVQRLPDHGVAQGTRQDVPVLRS